MDKDEIKAFVVGTLFWLGIIFVPVMIGVALEKSPSSSSSSYSDSHGSNECSSDCSGHDAGYEWAEQHSSCDADYSRGNSESFNEGFKQYVQDNC